MLKHSSTYDDLRPGPRAANERHRRCDDNICRRPNALSDIRYEARNSAAVNGRRIGRRPDDAAGARREIRFPVDATAFVKLPLVGKSPESGQIMYNIQSPTPPSTRYCMLTQATDNALVTSLGSCVFMDSGEYLLSGGSRARLPLEYYTKNAQPTYCYF
ncbi:hypothetical protein EVAR_34488_1 [Eumeta japonica]|uniref:Uncharacterized protein n=1 Tax=Eumeta variegata TaxID=151549 RepID=A0A4C1WVS4_EUMVA|nr:hypothetical protein EVAR_34488_1 [Eumeta japonica]